MTACYYCQFVKNNIGEEIIPGFGGPLNECLVSVLILLIMIFLILGKYLFQKNVIISNGVYAGIVFLTPFLSFFLIEISWNDSFFDISVYHALLNIAFYALIELVLVNLLRVKMIGLALCYFLTALVGLSNYFLVSFRGQPFTVTDIAAAYTALRVAGQYSYDLSDRTAFMILIVCLMLSLIFALQTSQTVARHSQRVYVILRGAVSAAAAVSLICWCVNVDFSSAYYIVFDNWSPIVTYRQTGFAPGFLIAWQKSHIDIPEDYSADEVDRIYSETVKDNKDEETQTATNKTIQPTIIAIMDESFADLSVMGNLECVKDNLRFYYSLAEDENTLEWGYNYVSTRGGGTCNTEFEFLTGDSMAFVNGNTPYSVFNLKNVPNLAQNLKEEGYPTIALHPENSFNWRRSAIYPEMGFDEFLAIDAFEGAETTVWNRVSDPGDFKKLIEVYKEQEDPAFIFNITMQNHGGYDEQGLAQLSEDEIVSVDEAYAWSTGLIEYQSLIAKTDAALEELIEFFRKEDSPVIICFFGDHQPAIGEDFDSQLLESGKTAADNGRSLQEKYYAVPYFIWANYDINADYSVKNSQGQTIMSANYLGAVLKAYAGLELSDYDEYRLAQREQIYAFNIAGYYANDNAWHDLNEENAYIEWVKNYELLQYNALFDKKRNTKYYEVGSSSSN